MSSTCVCFGEVLFDVLPDEMKAGGSPMNVAYHLAVLGQTSILISRIGSDSKGRELKTILEKKNIRLDHLQVDEQYPTGIAFATPDDGGDMLYYIKEDVAWDHIELKPSHDSLVRKASFFIFGSLVTRSAASRNTLYNLLDIPVTRVFDVNLRPPFVDRQNLEYQFSKTDILKMNEEELNMVTGWYVQFKDITDRIRFLQNHFQIPEIIVTRGAKGAIVNKSGQFCYHEGFPVHVTDTIGSGDSFVAAYLSGIIKQKTPEQILEFACALGAYVATKTGGCPAYTINDLIRFIKHPTPITT